MKLDIVIEQWEIILSARSTIKLQVISELFSFLFFLLYSFLIFPVIDFSGDYLRPPYFTLSLTQPSYYCAFWGASFGFTDSLVKVTSFLCLLVAANGQFAKFQHAATQIRVKFYLFDKNSKHTCEFAYT